jgi:hypothetical protein
LIVNDERGASTPDGSFRVFAGLRSDPFYMGFTFTPLHPCPNLVQHDNVLCIVADFDMGAILAPAKGSLFGVIAETVPVAGEVPRIDWVGRPEHTNMRLTNLALTGAEDIRDLWNQQTPFAIASELRPIFLQRLLASLKNWDMRDNVEDWKPAALAANVNVFLDDFLLFDVAKPITDTSHLEIEKSTINGLPYQTGGGRTPDANAIDILVTWLVNRDREFLHGGAAGPTKPSTKIFPFFAAPNQELQSVTESVDLAAAADEVWRLIGPFGGNWHPLIAKIELTGSGIGELRTIETIDGKQIIERLEAIDDPGMSYRYSLISGIPASNYTGTLAVRSKGSSSVVEWNVRYLANNQPDLMVRTIVSTWLKAGLAGLKSRFGGA